MVNKCHCMMQKLKTLHINNCAHNFFVIFFFTGGRLPAALRSFGERHLLQQNSPHQLTNFHLYTSLNPKQVSTDHLKQKGHHLTRSEYIFVYNTCPYSN